MAKSAARTIKAAPALRAGAGTDSTFLQECRAIIHFNNACNTEILIDTEAMTTTVQVIDAVAGKTYRGTVTLEEEA